MNERVMNIEALPAYFTQVFRTRRVKIYGDSRTMTIEPLAETAADKKYSCPFLGTAKGGTLTVDGFLAMTQTEKGLEAENEKRLLS